MSPSKDDHHDRAVEAELIERARGGCCESFEKIVLAHQDRLYNFLLRRTRDGHIAEEIAQVAFVRAWLNLSKFDSESRFSTWLFTIALRLAVDLERKRGRERAVHSMRSVASAAGGDDPAASVARSDESRALWSLADRILDADERTALWLRYGDEAPVQQIAQVLGKTRGAVNVLLHRARKRLEEAWSRRFGEDPANAKNSDSEDEESERSAAFRRAPCAGVQ